MANASSSETSMPRLGLRGFAVVLAVIIMSLLGALFGNTGWVYYIVVGIPGIWSLANLALIVFKRPVHPGAHIALDFIFTIVLLFFGIISLLAEQVSSLYGSSLHSSHSSWSMTVAAFALMVINGLLHFVHFVLGCYDVHKRRHASSVDYNPQKIDSA
ncbi:hypothetical protein N7489_002349 [Penicillium chrysogenum]|uniref:uncharacterized protein n=1 Tax=Penicillium chrysogenum TaxID=5076 RepID=UPI0024DF27C7|nr:uncharacterized protein N7489_002349 [Penicillium chrysogenum]KAJ5251939.1 hypothetical protein N7489_002349 [Penicillium chrysogenum]